MIQCSCRGLGCKLCRAKETPKIFLPIEPMGAVRTTQKQKFNDPRYEKYSVYKQHIRILSSTLIRLVEAGNPVIIKDLVFHMPIPKSGKTSGLINGKRISRKVNEGDPHINTPDVDNLVKGLFDALNGVAWADDNQVYKITNVEKVYSEYPGIEFGIEFISVK